MCENFLENIYRILVFVRSDIKNCNNIELIGTIIYGINQELTNSEMIDLVLHVRPQLKQQLVPQNGMIHKKHEQYKNFIIEVLQIVCGELENANYDIAYDIVDMLHVFPHIVIKNNAKQLKSFWKIYVIPLIKEGLLQDITTLC